MTWNVTFLGYQEGFFKQSRGTVVIIYGDRPQRLSKIPPSLFITTLTVTEVTVKIGLLQRVQYAGCGNLRNCACRELR
jgi:hypothetical protein